MNVKDCKRFNKFLRVDAYLVFRPVVTRFLSEREQIYRRELICGCCRRFRRVGDNFFLRLDDYRLLLRLCLRADAFSFDFNFFLRFKRYIVFVSIVVALREFLFYRFVFRLGENFIEVKFVGFLISSAGITSITSISLVSSKISPVP